MPVVKKGSGYLRLLEHSPSYGVHARNTYYGSKMLTNDLRSKELLSISNMNARCKENETIRIRSRFTLHPDSALSALEGSECQIEIGGGRINQNKNQN